MAPGIGMTSGLGPSKGWKSLIFRVAGSREPGRARRLLESCDVAVHTISLCRKRTVWRDTLCTAMKRSSVRLPGPPVHRSTGRLHSAEVASWGLHAAARATKAEKEHCR